MSYWQGTVKIGNLQVPRFIGGPLDGITDSPFRQLVRQFSQQELLYTEMRHVACVANDRTGALSLRFQQAERPLTYQIACNKVEFIKPALEKILAIGVDVLDLNIGCPANNVIKSGSGCALMADLPRLKECLMQLRTQLQIPLTLKMRAGFKEKNAITVAQFAQDAGVDAIAIHPRLRAEFFNGRPDYALAAQVKRAVTIPVLLSGNVINFKTAALAYEQTGVDGFLIGRGMWAKPWKLQEMAAHARGEQFVVDNGLVLRCALQHLENIIHYYGSKGIYIFRKHLPFYVKGFPAATELRTRLVQSTCAQQLKEGLCQALQM